ncbi:MAG: hypothetical protein FWG65_09655 [Turicibacter sp.]|nr:hypothetical protein [Turicibacter sp.]
MNIQTQERRSMEWLGNVAMLHPKCWTVLVNLNYGPEVSYTDMVGEIYAHTQTEEEAQEIRLSLGKTMGTIAIVKGSFSDEPLLIGGLWLDGE